VAGSQWVTAAPDFPDRLEDMSAKRAALGFKLHTGWAAVVAAASARHHVEVVLRRRIELLPSDNTVPRFVYHEAAELSLAEAAKLIQRAERAVRTAAQTAVGGIVNELKSGGVAIEAAGVATGSTTVPAELKAILKAHTLIHAAEGVLFQEAVAHSCERRELTVIRVRERDLWPKLGDAFRQEIDGLRNLIGPPWGADQKTATAAAIVALDDA
jgi:hypothetical protein